MRTKNRILAKRFSKAGKHFGSEKLSDTQIEARDTVQSLLNSKNKWLLQTRPCQICENTSYFTVSEIDRYLLNVSTVVCKVCGFMYTDPVMRQSDYIDFYKNYYRPLYTNAFKATDTFFNDQLKTGRRIQKYLSKITNLEGKTIVEIGTGAGGILKAFLDKGSNVIGCDFGEEYLHHGREFGLDLRDGDISVIPSSTADVVIYSHVLEHILNLDHEFENLKRILKPGGLVYVEVPGLFFIHYTYRGNFLRFLQNAHLYHFSKKTLINLMRKYHFSPIKVNQRINGVFRYDNKLELKNFQYSKSSQNVILLYLKTNEVFRPLLQAPWIIYDFLVRLIR